MTDRDPVLLVEGLSARRGEQLAVEQVSFQLARATDTVLVGSNGAGKSSLVSALLGLLPRASGSVEILGHALGPAGAFTDRLPAPEPGGTPAQRALRSQLKRVVLAFCVVRPRL